MKLQETSSTNLRSAISQLQRVSRRKRQQSMADGRDRMALIQESRQIDEAVRLLRWISK